ncbi:putative fatty acyl-CoA reductase CG5065 [Periplaneta americana]|uniref:putative fatty acyl-CoA reductase CG5065 n=1 Tax=Periplaneta americana TaxID=6978 RepID=UPI0037E9930E
MPHIKALVYVSTAFCNCQENETVLEEVYPTLYEPDFIIELVQKMTPEEIQEATPGLLKDHPNTYSFSKQLAENLVKSERRALPVAIVRPTIVLGTAKEPMSGWIDNVHTGGFAFIAGAGKGVFRVSCAEPDFVADLVPCDHVANLLIAAAWSAAVKSGDADLQVYHCSSGAHNPITWGQYTREVVSLVRRFPCRSVLWYPGAQCRTAVPRVALVVLLRHMLPAYLLRLLSGGDDELLKIQKKYWRGIQHVRYFTTRQWRFSTINTLALARQLCPRDRVTFAFDVASIHWPAYLESNVLGVRQHYHHDPPSTLKEARWKLRVYVYVTDVLYCSANTPMLLALPGIAVRADVFPSQPADTQHVGEFRLISGDRAILPLAMIPVGCRLRGKLMKWLLIQVEND